MGEKQGFSEGSTCSNRQLWYALTIPKDVYLVVAGNADNP